MRDALFLFWCHAVQYAIVTPFLLQKLREMLDITEIKEIWESIQRNKEDFSKQVNKWIEDGVAAIRDYADGKDNDFQPEAGNAVAWGIIVEAFR